MSDLPPYPGPPRWVKISGIIAAGLAVLVVLAIFTGIGGPHGPSRHMQTDIGGPSGSQTNRQ